MSVLNGSPEVVSLMVKAGADKNSKDALQRTAADYANGAENPNAMLKGPEVSQ